MEDKVYQSDAVVERRRFPRKPLNISLEFQVVESDENPHEISESFSENVSLGGLALQSEKRMKKGQELRLTLFIPPKEERSENKVFIMVPKERCLKVRIRARIMWNLPFVGNKFAYGLNFIELDPNDRPVYEEFLQEFYLIKPNL